MARTSVARTTKRPAQVPASPILQTIRTLNATHLAAIHHEMEIEGQAGYEQACQHSATCRNKIVALAEDVMARPIRSLDDVLIKIAMLNALGEVDVNNWLVLQGEWCGPFVKELLALAGTEAKFADGGVS